MCSLRLVSQGQSIALFGGKTNVGMLTSRLQSALIGQFECRGELLRRVLRGKISISSLCGYTQFVLPKHYVIPLHFNVRSSARLPSITSMGKGCACISSSFHLIPLESRCCMTANDRVGQRAVGAIDEEKHLVGITQHD